MNRNMLTAVACCLRRCDSSGTEIFGRVLCGNVCISLGYVSYKSRRMHAPDVHRILIQRLHVEKYRIFPVHLGIQCIHIGNGIPVL